MVTTKDIAWLAGLWEGEGSFSRKNYKRMTMQIGMTDYDVMKKAADIMGAKVHGPYGPYTSRNHKPVWVINIGSAKAASWMMTLYCLMGERRQAAIREGLGLWMRQKMYGRKSTCHPEKKHFGNGLCHKCYHRNYKRTYRRVLKSRAQLLKELF